MSSTMKISLLALATTAAAVPQYGYGHSKFHSSYKASASEGYPAQPYGTAPAQSYGHSQYGTGKPYPTGGYPMGRNSTHVPPYPTGSYGQGQASTIDVTSTSTKTIVKTVHVSPSPAGGNYQTSVAAVVQAASTGGSDQCGPATVTVTAAEKVTVTVEAGYSAQSYAPSSAPVKASSAPPAGQSSAYVASPPSSAAAVSSKPAQGGYSASASASQPAKPSSQAVVPVYSSAAPSATPSSSAPSTGSYSGSKRGLVYNDAGLVKSFSGKYGFASNWGQVENSDIGTMFVPMMHKPSDSTPEAWLANVDKAVQKGSTAVMGFNECDIGSQCALSPADACTAWKQYMNPISVSHPSITIVGPSISNGEPAKGMGIAWLSGFHDCCPDAVFHATNIHFYDNYDVGTIDRFKAQVEKAIAVNNKPVWITEFGLNAGATQDQAASFLKDCISYLDGNNMVQGYSWFMVGDGDNQLNSGSGLSQVGQVYAAGM